MTYVARLQDHKPIKCRPRDGDTMPLAVVAQNAMNSIEDLLHRSGSTPAVADGQDSTKLEDKRRAGIVTR